MFSSVHLLTETLLPRGSFLFRGETFQLKARLKWEILQEELHSTRSVQLEAIIPQAKSCLCGEDSRLVWTPLFVHFPLFNAEMSIWEFQMDSGNGLVFFHCSQVYLALFYFFTKSVLNGSSVKTNLFGRKRAVSFMQNVLVQIVARSTKSLVCGIGEMKLLWNMVTEDVPFSFPFSHV